MKVADTMDRTHNPFGETCWVSCLRENLTISCASSKGWRIQQETDLPGKESEPRSLDSRVAGNQDSEAYRQDFPWGSASHRAVTKVNADVASKMSVPEGRARNCRVKATWVVEI